MIECNFFLLKFYRISGNFPGNFWASRIYFCRNSFTFISLQILKRLLSLLGWFLLLPAMKFFFALMFDSFAALKRHFGRETKELCDKSTISNWLNSVSSSGKVDIRLWDKFSSGRKLILIFCEVNNLVPNSALDEKVFFFYFLNFTAKSTF